MQQDNNYIENKLRQLDSQQLPDLSHMDEHWQKMQAMLQPPVPKSKLRINNKGKLIGGGFGVIIITLCFLAYQKFNDNNKTQEQPKTISNTIIHDTASVKPILDVMVTDSTVLPIAAITSQYNKTNYSFKPGWGYFANPNADNDVPDAIQSGDSRGSINELDRATLLKKLMDQFVKAPKQFTINNTRDTVITAAEGTSIYIPANSIVDGGNTIDISITEYYKRSDIILNQLNTASDKSQLVTGGMINIKAMSNGKEVKIDEHKPLRLFMADTSNINMSGMQLFEGDKSSGAINWIPRGQYFSRDQLVTEVRVLNIVDQPYKIKVNRIFGRETAYFIMGDTLSVTKDNLKKILKEKYGYNKIRLRSNIRNRFHEGTGKDFSHTYGESIGDSVWMKKELADRYKLISTASRQVIIETKYITSNFFDDLSKVNTILSENVLKNIQNKYKVDITKLGWINCDRFYTDRRKKISYQVDLGDSGMNYYCMLVFDNINSMMTGTIDGNKVSFPNIPIGEPVKIISMGINKEGETVYSVTSATTSDQTITGLNFEKISVAELKTSLSKLDK